MHDLNIAVHAGNCIFKPNLDPHQEVCTRLRAGPPLAPAKEIKDIPEPGEVGGESSAAESSASGIRAFRSIRIGLVTHVVILPFLLLVREDTVGFVDLLELLLGPVVLADIRMEFAGEVAVGLS